jgi:electron transport complex protein RnfE
MHSALGGARSGAAPAKTGLTAFTLAVLPALAVTATGVNGLVTGAAVILTMTGASLMTSLVWRFVHQDLRGFAYILFAATVASIAQMTAEVAIPRVAASLGLYLALVSFSCALTSYWELFDEDRELEDSLVRAVGNGAVYLAALTVVGCLREALGSGAIFGFSLGAEFQPMRMLASARAGLSWRA